MKVLILKVDVHCEREEKQIQGLCEQYFFRKKNDQILIPIHRLQRYKCFYLNH